MASPKESWERCFVKEAGKFVPAKAMEGTSLCTWQVPSGMTLKM